MMEKKKFIVLVSILLVAIIGVIGAIIVDSKNNEGVPIDDGAIVGEIVLDEDASELPELSAHAEDDYVLSDEPATYEGNDYELSDEPATYEPATVPADSADVPDDAVLTDEYGMYRVPMEWAAEHGGIFVERNGGLYAVSPEIPRYVGESYNVGYSAGSSSTETMLLYLSDFYEINDDIPSKVRRVVVSAGDFPILQVSRNEKLEVFNQYMIDEVVFAKSEFVGYTIPAVDGGNGANDYFPIIDHVMPNNFSRNNMNVFDTGDNLVADVHDLEYGKTYLFEYYTGTEYHEVEITADSRCYVHPEVSDDGKIALPIELAKANYAVVDISSLEPGFYTIMGNTVFEVVD